MQRVLTCIQFDEATQQCATEAWVYPQDPALAALPTIEQAVEVGAAFMTSLLILAGVARLLRPPKEATP